MRTHPSISPSWLARAHLKWPNQPGNVRLGSATMAPMLLPLVRRVRALMASRSLRMLLGRTSRIIRPLRLMPLALPPSCRPPRHRSLPGFVPRPRRFRLRFSRGLLALLWRRWLLPGTVSDVLPLQVCLAPLALRAALRAGRVRLAPIPAFTRTSPPQPTVTSHARRGARATMSRHAHYHASSRRRFDFATRSQGRPRPSPDRVHLRYGRPGPHHAAPHPASRRSSCAWVIYFFHGSSCAGSPTRQGCAARRRTAATTLLPPSQGQPCCRPRPHHPATTTPEPPTVASASELPPRPQASAAGGCRPPTARAPPAPMPRQARGSGRSA
jgi:hypothetical protein